MRKLMAFISSQFGNNRRYETKNANPEKVQWGQLQITLPEHTSYMF